MKKPQNKLLLILLVVFLLPLIIFTAYQVSTLNENEQVITEIYDNQLEAILFSVNQYSQDQVDDWAHDINLAILDTAGTEYYIDLFLEENEAVTYILWSDTAFNRYEMRSLTQEENPQLISLLQDTITRRGVNIERLRKFQEGGYAKKEPLGRLEINPLPPQSGLMFLLDENVSQYQICFLVIDPNLFITQTLSQKIQSVTQEKFVISAYDDATNAQITILDTIKIDNPPKKPLWLLPDYSLGIILKGNTIQNLAKQRTTNNLLILLGVDLILILGLVLIYRNIKKEIQLAQIKSDFVSNVSHEIRTPLALISMFAETLQMDRAPTEEKRQEYYNIIGHEANRLGSIVNKILSFSKLEAGKAEYTLEPSNLSEIVKQVLNTYDYHLRSQGFTCNFDPNGNLPEISADKGAVSEAIINLLDNAIKYSVGSNEVGVRLGQQQGFVFVEVEDHGIGITAENQKYIFDKFYRVPTGSVHNAKGTGLGLTLVSHIMEAHKGAIKLDSIPGKGSRFKLLFPTNSDENRQL